MRAFAVVLAVALLSACSSSSPEPDDATTMAGDGDGDPGDGDGDEDPEPADLPEPLLDVPSEGLGACCTCFAPDHGSNYCEFDVAADASECQALGEANGYDWEWHTDCENIGGDAICPNSCAA